ncbi:MAG: hypothetical protein NTW33_01015, partial [Methanoregula sp.]|nr:hypothetical protein [Methanoregula sp.]
IQQLQFATNLSYNAIYRALHGYQSRGQTYSGLLDKCPAIGYTDRTIVCDDADGRSVRRRSHAYLFTLATYRIWCTGGAVWLRPDSNNHDDKNNDETCNIAETFSTIAENSASLANDDTGDETQNAASIINTDLSSSSSCSKSRITGPPVPCITTGTVCHRETGFAANDETVFDNLLQINPILGKVADTPAIKNAAKNILLQTAANQGGFPHVSFLDFKPIGCHDNRTTCVSCGRKGVDYIEKVTPARESRKDKLAVRICKKCFEVATRKEQTRAPPLPGTIVLSRMVRISKDIGRCTVCNLGKAMFIDKEATVHLCQQCYEREARAVGPVKGGAGP